MFRNRWIVVATFAFMIALGLMLASLTTRTTAAPAPSDVDQASFRGKVLLVHFNLGFGMGAVVLEEVKVRKFGEHAFLLGKVVESQGGQGDLKGKTVWQNMNGITQIVECENAERAKKMLKTLPAGIGAYATPAVVPLEGTTTPAAPPAAPPPPPNP